MMPLILSALLLTTSILSTVLVLHNWNNRRVGYKEISKMIDKVSRLAVKERNKLISRHNRQN